MSTLDQFDHPERKQDKSHFKNLVQVALADGNIDALETEMLQRLGKRMGLTEPEISGLIESTKQSLFDPPYELSKRFEQVYNIIKMILADGKIENSEMRLASGLALKSGFTDEEIPGLLMLLIDGIRNNEDVDELFQTFNKKKAVKR